MKKKILGAATAMALAAVVTFNLNFNSEVSKFSALNMANIEALANGESGGLNCNTGWTGPYCGTFIPAEGGILTFYYKGQYD